MLRVILTVVSYPGLLSVASYSFLVSITQRQQVAQIQGRPVYAVTNVAIIPLSSQADANRAISQARKDVVQDDGGLDESASEEEDIPDNETDEAATEINSAPASPNRETFHHSRDASVNSIAEDVIGKKVRFGSFAANWLSRKNLGLPTRPAALKEETPASPFGDVPSPSEQSAKDEEATEVSAPEEANSPLVENKDQSSQQQMQKSDLLPKTLRYTKLLFASHSFFFAYDYDITRPFSGQEARNGNPPLYKVVDPLVCLEIPVSGEPFTNCFTVLLEQTFNVHIY